MRGGADSVVLSLLTAFARAVKLRQIRRRGELRVAKRAAKQKKKKQTQTRTGSTSKSTQHAKKSKSTTKQGKKQFLRSVCAIPALLKDALSEAVVISAKGSQQSCCVCCCSNHDLGTSRTRKLASGLVRGQLSRIARYCGVCEYG